MHRYRAPWVDQPHREKSAHRWRAARRGTPAGRRLCSRWKKLKIFFSLFFTGSRLRRTRADYSRLFRTFWGSPDLVRIWGSLEDMTAHTRCFFRKDELIAGTIISFTRVIRVRLPGESKLSLLCSFSVVRVISRPGDFWSSSLVTFWLVVGDPDSV